MTNDINFNPKRPSDVNYPPILILKSFSRFFCCFVVALGSFSLNANQKTQLEKLCIFCFWFFWLDCWLVACQGALIFHTIFTHCLVMLLKYISWIFYFHFSLCSVSSFVLLWYWTFSPKYIKIKLNKKKKTPCYGKQFKHKVYNFVFSVRCKITFFYYFILFLIGFQESKIKQHKLLEAFIFCPKVGGKLKTNEQHQENLCFKY